MLIRCPECGFERELNASQIPDSAVMATCPQCRLRFRFRDGDDEAAPGPHPRESDRENAAGEPVDRMAPEEPRRPSPSPSADGGEDDPLPPGAITPSMPGAPRREVEPPRRAARNSVPDTVDEPDPERPQAPLPPRDERSLFTGPGGTTDLLWETAPLNQMFIAFYQTVLQILFAAPAFFTRVGASTASLLRPCVFYVLIGTFQSVVQHFWLLARLNELASMQDPRVQASLDSITQSLSLPLLLISMPPLLMVQLLFYAAMFNLMIRLVRADRANFSVTLRVVAYSAAPGILCVVPVVGTYAASLWFAFCCFVGCKHALNLDWQRTALAIVPLYVLAVAFSLHVNKMIMGLVQ